MEAGELWTRWTVRVAMALYTASLVLRGLGMGRRSWLIASRASWTVGGLAFLVHVACAFTYYHHWSHAEAYEATARRSAELTGFNSGAGLYANYAFILVWMADVGWWWGDMESYLSRPRAVEWVVQGFMGFIAINATVVFGEGFIRWAGVAACLLLAAVWAYRIHFTNST